MTIKMEFDGMLIKQGTYTTEKRGTVKTLTFVDGEESEFQGSLIKGLEVDKKFSLVPCHFILDVDIVGFSRMIIIKNVMGKLNG